MDTSSWKNHQWLFHHAGPMLFLCNKSTLGCFVRIWDGDAAIGDFHFFNQNMCVPGLPSQGLATSKVLFWVDSRKYTNISRFFGAPKLLRTWVAKCPSACPPSQGVDTAKPISEYLETFPRLNLGISRTNHGSLSNVWVLLGCMRLGIPQSKFKFDVLLFRWLSAI